MGADHALQEEFRQRIDTFVLVFNLLATNSWIVLSCVKRYSEGASLLQVSLETFSTLLWANAMLLAASGSLAKIIKPMS